jgi:hypothetical protein
VTCAMLAGVPLISKEEEKSDGIVMKSFCHKHGPRFCFRGRWVIDPKKTFVEQIDVLEGTLPAAELVQQLLAAVVEYQRCGRCAASLPVLTSTSSAWAQCNSVLSLGYTGSYFSSLCISSQIHNLAKLSAAAVASVVEAYVTRFSQCIFITFSPGTAIASRQPSCRSFAKWPVPPPPIQLQ